MGKQKKLIKRFTSIAGLTVLALGISACGTRYTDQSVKPNVDTYKNDLITPSVGYKLNTKAWTPEPNCVIVMPLNTPQFDSKQNSIVRRGLYAHLAPKGYRTPKMSDVDALIARKSNIKINEISEALQCNYIMSGEITEFNKEFFIVYSEVNIGAKVNLKRVSDQKILWEANYTASLKDGGLPLSPLAATSSVFMAGKNLADEQTLRAVDDLSRHLMNTLPDANISTFTNFAKKEDLSWKQNIDTWLSSIAEIDKESELSALLKRPDLTELQRESAFNRLVSINNKPHYYLQWSESRMRHENYSGALELLNNNIFKNSENPKVWYLRGRALAASGRFDEADKNLISAIARNKGNVDYYNALAYVNSRKGDTDRTRAAYEKVIQLDPNQPFAWYNLAVLNFNNGNYQKSLNAFANAGNIYKQQKRQEQVNRVIGDLQDLLPFMKKETVLEVQKTLSN